MIVASSTFVIVFISFFTFLSVGVYQAHQRKIEIARMEEYEKEMEEARLIAEKQTEYLEKCKKIARPEGIEIHSYGVSSFIAGHPKYESQCTAYVEKQLKEEAEVRAIAHRYAEQKLRQYQQTTPSGIDYSHRERAYEDRASIIYQNASPNMRPK